MGRYELTSQQYTDFNSYYATNHPTVNVDFGYQDDDGTYYVDKYYIEKLDMMGLDVNAACQSLYTLDKEDVFNSTNFQDANELEVDDDGRQITKTATTYKGWRYLAHVFEIETSTIGGIFSQDWDDNDRGDYSIKFYDDTDTELVAGTQAELDSDCVKTILTFAPSYDYDIIGGTVHQHTTPTENVRLWVIAGATDLKHLPGTVKEFVGGINFKYITPGTKVDTDGRASARLNYTTTGVPTPTNKMEYIFEHPAGHQHDLMIIVEYFRA